jgi:hypothetical protein
MRFSSSFTFAPGGIEDIFIRPTCSDGAAPSCGFSSPKDGSEQTTKRAIKIPIKLNIRKENTAKSRLKFLMTLSNNVKYKIGLYRH